jgi:hypothetical protein
LYAACVAYEAVTGAQLELTDVELAQVPFVHDPVGEPYPEDAAGWRRQYPRLWRLFGPRLLRCSPSGSSPACGYEDAHGGSPTGCTG